VEWGEERDPFHDARPWDGYNSESAWEMSDDDEGEGEEEGTEDEEDSEEESEEED